MTKKSAQNLKEMVDLYTANLHLFKLFQEGVTNSIRFSPELNSEPHAAVHSVKTRLKDPSHLAEKITRKTQGGNVITTDNLFSQITDLCGVRILHLHQAQAEAIHHFIMKQVTSKEWHLNEKPVAYSWDPDSSDFFKSLGLRVQIKPSHYTSIHYVVKPKKLGFVACEIQVRTLFEEIWGEVDHTVNYPNPTSNQFTKEQLRVLGKLVSTGSRLTDSVFKLHK